MDGSAVDEYAVDDNGVGIASYFLLVRGTPYVKSWVEAQGWCKWAIDHRRPFVLTAPANEIGFRLELALANDETIEDNMVVPK